MVSDNAGNRTGRHTARKNAARELAARTGMPYTAALRHVTQAATPREPRHRWLLTGELRAWLAGETWRGVAYGDLYDWLDNEVDPAYLCDWCSEPGNAAEADSSISLVVTAYDPDLSPATMHLATRKYHAACRPSSVSWVRKIDIPHGPQRIGLPASVKPEAIGEFELDARALLHRGYEDQAAQAVLLVTARVVEDHRQGARAWLSELQLHLNGEGFGHPESLTRAAGTDWSLRIVTGYPSSLAPQWIALRTSPDETGSSQHMFLAALDLPADWVEVARQDGQVAVVIGPCVNHWDLISVPGEFVDEMDEAAAGTGGQPSGPGAGCGCSALTANQVAELVYAGVFVAGPVRVTAGGEDR